MSSGVGEGGAEGCGAGAGRAGRMWSVYRSVEGRGNVLGGRELREVRRAWRSAVRRIEETSVRGG